MILIALVGAVLAGLLTWKFIDMEDDIKELRSRIEALEDETDIEDDCPF